MTSIRNMVRENAAKSLAESGMIAGTARDKWFPGAEVVVPVIVNEVIEALKSKGISFGVSTPVGGVGLNIKELVAGTLAERGMTANGTGDKWLPGAEVVVPVIVNEVIEALKSKGISFGVSTPVGGVGLNIKELIAGTLAERGASSNNVGDKWFPGAEVVVPMIVNEVIEATR